MRLFGKYRQKQTLKARKLYDLSYSNKDRSPILNLRDHSRRKSKENTMVEVLVVGAQWVHFKIV